MLKKKYIVDEAVKELKAILHDPLLGEFAGVDGHALTVELYGDWEVVGPRIQSIGHVIIDKTNVREVWCFSRGDAAMSHAFIMCEEYILARLQGPDYGDLDAIRSELESLAPPPSTVSMDEAVKELCQLLRPVLMSEDEMKEPDMHVDILLWEQSYGGVRIAEISIGTETVGASHMRGDIIYSPGAGVSKLFLMCEEWLVMRAYGDDAGDLPGLTERIQAWDKVPKLSERPSCMSCGTPEKKAPAEFLVKVYAKDEKKFRWVRACRDCLEELRNDELVPGRTKSGMVFILDPTME
jgi:hypothetical protein